MKHQSRRACAGPVSSLVVLTPWSSRPASSGAGATADTSLAEWETVIRVNLTGAFLAIKHALPALIASGGGAIVTVGSVASLVAAGRAASYDASKGGLLQFTRAVAVEYADAGIRANCVCPGIVKTPLATNSEELHGPVEPAKRQSRPVAPMSRRAEPEEIAALVAFLCYLRAQPTEDWSVRRGGL